MFKGQMLSNKSLKDKKNKNQKIKFCFLEGFYHSGMFTFMKSKSALSIWFEKKRNLLLLSVKFFQ